MFDGGHAGTGLSIAEGLAEARDLRHGLERIAVVVGDAALMSGLSLEALNDIGHRQTQLLIVLNDNEMSISPTVGAFSQVPLADQAVAAPGARARAPTTGRVERIPVVGPTVLELEPAAPPVGRPVRPARASCSRTSGSPTSAPCPATTCTPCSRRSGGPSSCPGPAIVHVRTQKGRGYRPAETDQVGFHGAALPPIDRSAPGADGVQRLAGSADADRVDGRRRRAAARGRRRADEAPELHRGLRGRADRARPDRSADRRDHGGHADRAPGMARFQAEFPDRFFDVGIAEQHAMTLATGLAMGGMRPVVALYSTFLQRAFDQTVHDVCQNDQPVLIAVDRAGLVGEDGTSHQGMFTLPAQRQLPNLVIASPKDEQELRSLLHTALAQDHPFALHYPRDAGFGLAPVDADGHPGRPGRGPARGPRPAVRRLRPDRGAGARGGRCARGRGLVGRGHQRPVRASRSTAS